MSRFLRRAKLLLISEDGPTAVEYGVLLALLVVVALAAITLLGEQSAEMFNTVGEKLQEAGAE